MQYYYVNNTKTPFTIGQIVESYDTKQVRDYLESTVPDPENWTIKHIKADLLCCNQDGDIPVWWFKYVTKHVVIYGNEFKTLKSSIDACHEFGECVLHSLTCVGKLERNG